MLINSETANLIIDTAVSAVTEQPDTFVKVLDRIPAAIYVTDNNGTITYFNRECVELAGRTPQIGHDKWCVTWKLYTTEGERLPHDQCPMAVSIRERRPVRDVCAIAKRPDGTSVSFTPYPTPIFDRDGNLIGAVNLLMETSHKNRASYLRDQAANCRRIAAATNPEARDNLNLMASKYDAQASKLSRLGPR